MTDLVKLEKLLIKSLNKQLNESCLKEEDEDILGGEFDDGEEDIDDSEDDILTDEIDLDDNDDAFDSEIDPDMDEEEDLEETWVGAQSMGAKAQQQDQAAANRQANFQNMAAQKDAEQAARRAAMAKPQLKTASRWTANDERDMLKLEATIARKPENRNYLKKLRHLSEKYKKAYLESVMQYSKCIDILREVKK